jgi:predicted RNase H-like HicB family nuclease
MSSARIEFNLAIATRKDEESGVYVGFCPMLKLYSQGRTAQEAEDAAVSAATLFIGTCYERDILHSVLRDRGLKKIVAKPKLAHGEEGQYISVQGFDRAIERSIPLELLSSVGEEALCQ